MNSPNTQKDTPSPPALALHFRKFGENGPDLVVLHGLFGSGKTGAVLQDLLKMTFKSGRWTHVIMGNHLMRKP